MNIKWLGQACFYITAENGTRVLTDPYANMLGYKLPDLEADIVTTSHDHKDHNHVEAVRGSFLHLNKPGSFTKDGIKITGVETFHDKVSGAKRGKNIMYKFEIDGLQVCHCGDLGHLLNFGQITETGKTDILLLPVGGRFTLNAPEAVKVMNQLKPKVVIPMHYRTKALGILGLIFGKVEEFIAVSGLNAKEYGELKINQDNIGEHSQIAVLKYE